MKRPTALLLSFLILITASTSAFAAGFTRLVIPAGCHPAVASAARIIARKAGLPESAITTATLPAAPGRQEVMLLASPANADQAQYLGSVATGIQHDGYAIVFKDGAAAIFGVRPRSLLYAAGDYHLWKDRTEGTFLREPSFAIRTASYYGRQPVAEFVAALGVNAIIGSREAAVTFKDTLPEVFKLLSPRDQSRLESSARTAEARAAEFARECHDADVLDYPFIYGNDFSRWSPALYAAIAKAYPGVVGKSAPASWERATLCPSDPMTWKILEAYVKEFTQRGHGDGLYVTFWDNYGLDCQCDPCVKSGMNKFGNQLYECLKHYHDTVGALGKPVVIRTWSSGVAHWLGEQWVHAPGYDHFSGSGIDLWGRVFRELPSDLVIQTKVYHADCQPDPRFSPLLGQARPHTEIAEYQITGQTTGRFYFPASTVNHTAATMKKSFDLVGWNGGVSVYPGGTKQSNYDLFRDNLNSINLYAWRELSWQVGADINKIWLDWATPIYGAKAAPHVIKALQLSEDAVNHSFSTLGMGSDTNSGFAKTIARRETLLKYTNRYFLPEFKRNLEPTKANIARVIAEKDDCLKKIDQMFRELELARPYLRKEQAAELATRFEWLREFTTVAKALDESLWRFRYLRYLASMLTTDPEQLKAIAEAYDTVKKHQKLMFKFDPAQQLSCYDVPLGELRQRPSLDSPSLLMQELYSQSKAFVEESVGPDGIDKAWVR